MEEATKNRNAAQIKTTSIGDAAVTKLEVTEMLARSRPNENFK